MPSEESLNWRPLTYNNVRGLRGVDPILAVRADGKGYYGKVFNLTPDYVELLNGSQKQLLRFFDSPTQFALVVSPPFNQRKLADRTLFKKDSVDGNS